MNNKRRQRIFLGVGIIMIFFVVIIIVAKILNLNDYVFDIITAITALLGAYFIWLEFRRSRDLEEAQFILDLNNEFNSSSSLTEAREIIKKGNDEIHKRYYHCSEDKKAEANYISEDDNKKLVSYFTFFETFSLLLKRNVFDISVIDELFATRFFEATNNPIIQDMKIGIYKSTYKNLYDLHNRWRNYRINNHKKVRKPLFCLSNYYDIADGYELRPLKLTQIDDVLSLQDEITTNLINKNIFVGVNKNRFIELLNDERNYNLCIFEKKSNELIGYCNLTLGKYSATEYYKELKDINKENTLYLRTIFVKEKHRGKGIQKSVIKHFLKTAIELDYENVLCTVSPLNMHSLKNFKKMEFNVVKEIKPKYGNRLVLVHKINKRMRKNRKYIY